MDALLADLKRTVPDGGDEACLTIFIHGLGQTFDQALARAARFGQNLYGLGGYRGLVIGFSWPSYDAVVSAAEGHYATSRTRFRSSGSVRDNLYGSAASFVSLAKLIGLLRERLGPRTRLRVTIVTHSEGNFLLLVGADAILKALEEGRSQDPPPPWVSRWRNFDDALMVAADVSAMVFQPLDGQPARAQAITKIFDRVTAYYSTADILLASSNFLYNEFHDPQYPTRLGQIGPYGYPSFTATPNVIGVDCTRVTVHRRDRHVHDIPDLLRVFDVHESYQSLPEVLLDQTRVMTGQSTDDLRIQYPHTSHPAYVLKRSTPAGPSE
jgi:esterase/lipase superfamily enzyme